MLTISTENLETKLSVILSRPRIIFSIMVLIILKISKMSGQFQSLSLQEKRVYVGKRQQILILSFCGVLIFWTYSGCLTSLMAVTITEPPFQSLEDLLDMPDFKLYVKMGTSEFGQIKEWAKENKHEIDYILKTYNTVDALIAKMVATTSGNEAALRSKNTFLAQLIESN